MNRLNTIEDCYRLASLQDGYCLSNKYINSHTKYKWRCSLGHIWEAQYGNIYMGQWCPVCDDCKQRNTIEDCYRLAKERDGYFIDTEYKNNTTKYKWKCKENHIWEANYNSILQGRWCPYCSGHPILSIIDCKKLAIKNGGLCLSETYIDAHTKYEWECQNGHRWMAIYNNIQQGKWCPKCSNEKSRCTDEECHSLAEIHDGYFLSSKYVGTQIKYKWKCKNGHIWAATHCSIKRGTWCPKCAKGKRQREIIDIIERILNDKAESEYSGLSWYRNPKPGRLFRMDFWFEKYKFGGEYDGEQHFQPVCFGGMTKKEAQKNFKNQKKRDKLKNKLIAAHPKEVKYFIRFRYDEPLTEECVRNKLINAGVLPARSDDE